VTYETVTATEMRITVVLSQAAYLDACSKKEGRWRWEATAA
jgi:hypothetical protein